MAVGECLGAFFAFVSVFIINMSANKCGQEYMMICLELFLVIILIWISELFTCIAFKATPTLLFSVIRTKTECCRWNATSRCSVTADKRNFSILLESISINTICNIVIIWFQCNFGFPNLFHLANLTTFLCLSFFGCKKDLNPYSWKILSGFLILFTHLFFLLVCFSLFFLLFLSSLYFLVSLFLFLFYSSFFFLPLFFLIYFYLLYVYELIIRFNSHYFSFGWVLNKTVCSGGL